MSAIRPTRVFEQPVADLMKLVHDEVLVVVQWSGVYLEEQLVALLDGD